MGILDRRRKRSSAARVLTASGVRITRTNVEQVRRFAGARQDWQTHAWAYRDLIGELRQGLQFQCRAVGRVAFMPAQINPERDEPWLLDSDECTFPEPFKRALREELGRLPLDSMSWKTRLAENLAVPGEVWLHGYDDPLDDESERWDVRSVDEVVIGRNGEFSINNGGNRPDEIDLDTDALLRLWQPHPARYWQADSALRALLDTCEDVVLIGKELRAASRSRIAANGILAIPDGMTLRSTRASASGETPDHEATSDKFAADLAQQVISPIGNEGEPGAVVPIVIIGDPEDIAAIRHIEISREDSPKLLDKLDRALHRLGSGMDIPGEIITGTGDANHWSAWQISTDTFRHHIEPLVRVVDDALAEGYLRNAMASRPEGFDPKLIAQVTVWHDAGNLTENPNRGQDALNAFDRGAIGFKALGEALGFAEGELPDDDELARMIALKAGIAPDIAAAVLRAQLGERYVPEGQQSQQQPRVIEGEQPRQLPPGAPGQRGDGRSPTGGDGIDPEQPVPDGPPGVVASVRERDPEAFERGRRLVEALLASGSTEGPRDDDGAGRAFAVDEDAHRELLDLERAVRARVTAEADAALQRIIERASNRVRSRARRDPEAQRQLAALPNTMPTHVLGRQATLALGVTERELLADAFEVLGRRFRSIIGRAIRESARIAARILGLSGDAGRDAQVRIVEGMTANVEPAWQQLEQRLTRQAERELFDPRLPDDEPEGEIPEHLVGEGAIRAAMAEIGGILDESGGIDPDTGVSALDHPAGGLTSGTLMAQEFERAGGERLGFEWHYGITPREREFEPHRHLHHERFVGFDDEVLNTLPRWPRYAWVGPKFYPGDHVNCGCDYMPLWAIPEHIEVVEANTALDFPYMRQDRALAEDDDSQPGGGYPTGPTTVQIARDERERVRKLQDRYITDREAR